AGLTTGFERRDRRGSAEIAEGARRSQRERGDRRVRIVLCGRRRLASPKGSESIAGGAAPGQRDPTNTRPEGVAVAPRVQHALRALRNMFDCGSAAPLAIGDHLWIEERDD